MEEIEIIKSMYKAIKGNDLLKIKNMVEQNKDILNIKTPLGSFLDVATTFGMYDIAVFFIEKGIDVNKKIGIGNSSSIATAAFKGNLNIVKLLYDNGAILDVSTPEGNPLFASIPDNHIEVAKFLIDHGIDVTAKYDIGDIDDCDAMEYARQYGQTEIYEYIKEKIINKECEK